MQPRATIGLRYRQQSSILIMIKEQALVTCNDFDEATINLTRKKCLNSIKSMVDLILLDRDT